MRVLIVSWEYPPVVVGGLGRHVHHLAEALAARGEDVVVLTRRPSGTDALSHPTSDTTTAGVRIVAVAEDPPEFDFSVDMMAWTLAMGHGFIRAGLSRLGEWRPDVVHAHDWLVAHPAITLAEFFGAPLVATLHATEAGRHSGWVAGHVNRQVHSVEWWLAHAADALITCSRSMRDEVRALFGPSAATGNATAANAPAGNATPASPATGNSTATGPATGPQLPPINVIHNGIDLATWSFSPRVAHDGPPRLLFAGRLEYEKGIQDLIEALPAIRRAHPGTTATIAGDGTQLEWLRELAVVHGVTGCLTFAGRQDHDGLVGVMRSHDAIVLPSRYEPFGIVALEAAATGIPLVTSTAGGLGEAVTDGQTGVTFTPADVASLTAAVCTTLDDPVAAAQRAVLARDRLTDEFSWPVIARRTVAVYADARRRPHAPLGRPVIPRRPLPERDPGR